MHALDARLLNRFGLLIGDQRACFDDDFAGFGVLHGLNRIAADHAGAQRLDELVAVLDLGEHHALGRLATGGKAVFLAHDDVLRNVDQTTGEVTGVRRTKRGIGQAFARAVGGDEELQNGEAFTEVRANRNLDDLTARVGHESAHTGELTDLCRAAARAGVCHHVDRVELVQRAHQLLGDEVGGHFPNLDDALSALCVGEHTHAEELVDLDDLDLRFGNHILLLGGNLNILEADGDAAARGIGKAELLDAVEHLRRRRGAVLAVAAVHDVAEVLLGDQLVDLEREEVLFLRAIDAAEVLRNGVVEDHAADRGVHDLPALLAVPFALEADFHPRLQRDLAGLVGHDGFVLRVEDLALALCTGTNHGQIVATDDHVLRGRHDRTAILRFQDVVAREHEEAGFRLRLNRERHVNGHLVSVEVRVVRGADQRVELERATLDEDRLKRLNTESMQRRCAV